MAAGRVAYHCHPVQIEPITLVDRRKVIDCQSYVQQRVRIAGSDLANPAVFDVPGGIAPLVQVARERTHEVEVEGCFPKAAVNQHHHGQLPRFIGDRQLPKL